MAVTCKAYAHALHSALLKLADLEDDEIKCMLCTSSYTPNQQTHDFKDDVTNEVEGTGYTAGGVVLANVDVSVATLTITVDADDPQWTSSTITARYAVIYDATPATDATRPLFFLIDFGEDKSSSNGTFKLAFHASGIYAWTES